MNKNIVRNSLSYRSKRCFQSSQRNPSVESLLLAVQLQSSAFEGERGWKILTILEKKANNFFSEHSVSEGVASLLKYPQISFYLSRTSLRGCPPPGLSSPPPCRSSAQQPYTQNTEWRKKQITPKRSTNTSTHTRSVTRSQRSTHRKSRMYTHNRKRYTHSNSKKYKLNITLRRTSTQEHMKSHSSQCCTQGKEKRKGTINTMSTKYNRWRQSQNFKAKYKIQSKIYYFY